MLFTMNGRSYFMLFTIWPSKLCLIKSVQMNSEKFLLKIDPWFWGFYLEENIILSLITAEADLEVHQTIA